MELRLPGCPLFDVRQGGLSLSAEFTLSPDLVWFRGHFAGIPVLPGAAELLFVCALAEVAGAFPGHAVRVTGAEAVKFVSPALPRERLRADLKLDAAGGRLAFRVTSSDGSRVFSRGTLISGESGTLPAPGGETDTGLTPIPVMDRERLSLVMPQKEPMLMADALLSFAESPDEGTVSGVTSFTPAPSKCAASPEGRLLHPVLVTEAMAQCVCAVMTEWHMRRGLPVPAGLLLGARDLVLEPDALGAPRARFTASAESSFFDESRGVFSCSVTAGGRSAAAGRLSVLWLMPEALRELALGK